MTTPIDEIIGQLLGKSSVEFMNHPDGKKIIMPAEELYKHQVAAKLQLYKAISDLEIFSGCCGCSCDALDEIKTLFGIEE